MEVFGIGNTMSQAIEFLHLFVYNRIIIAQEVFYVQFFPVTSRTTQITY